MNAEQLAKCHVARCEELEIDSSYSRVSKALLVAIEVLQRVMNSGIDWRAHPRVFETMERCLEDNDKHVREALAKIRGETS